MLENQICRRRVRLSLSSRRHFRIPGAEPHYAPDLPLKLEHLQLDVRVDPRSRLLEGKVTQTIRVIMPDQKRFKLDQTGLKISEVRIHGKNTPFLVEGEALWVSFPEGTPPLPNEKFELIIHYQAPHPRRGFYFTGPDEDYPKKRYQAWSQGQDEDTHYWIPTFDYPNQKATTEVIATVPRGFTAISNGALVERKELGDWTRFHYKLGLPHVTYLITLAVGEFSEWADSGPQGLPVQYYVPPGREADGKRAFGNTPQMIEAFSQKIGVSYPYEKYSQVAVQDFIFGGMENTSATTQTDRTLHDARAHLDTSSDPLVSHELAHQWFGDLLTCRDWSHGWLNEGFATFMERVWIESNIKEYGTAEKAREEAKYYSYTDFKEHQREDSEHYRRPIVCNTYVEPTDLFDTHLYQKGGLVLNLLRATLGEEAFWKSIQLYVSRHRGQNVETLDLIRAIEDATGRNMRRFFDEWVFSGGYPEFEISYEWHEEQKLAEFVIEQKQTEGRTTLEKDGVVTSLFHLTPEIELTTSQGKNLHRIHIGSLRERIFLPAPSKPLMVRFDLGSAIPKVLRFPRAKELLFYQLKNDTDCMGRIEAAQELVKIPHPDIVTELGKALLADPFWGVQAEIASALAEIRTSAARDALIAGLSVKHPKARRAIVKALSCFRDPKTADALRPLAQSDPSYFVEAESIYSWAKTRSKPGQSSSSLEINEEANETEAFLISQLKKESHLDPIRSQALRGLAEFPGIFRGEHPEALSVLMKWTHRGKPEEARLAAISALGTIAKSAVMSIRTPILELFQHLADEDLFRLRMKLVQTLQETQLPDVIPILEKIRHLDLDGRVKRDAWVAMDSLKTAATTPETVQSLKIALEKMEEEQKKLRSLIEEYRAGIHTR